MAIFSLALFLVPALATQVCQAAPQGGTLRIEMGRDSGSDNVGDGLRNAGSTLRADGREASLSSTRFGGVFPNTGVSFGRSAGGLRSVIAGDRLRNAGSTLRADGREASLSSARFGGVLPGHGFGSTAQKIVSQYGNDGKAHSRHFFDKDGNFMYSIVYEKDGKGGKYIYYNLGTKAESTEEAEKVAEVVLDQQQQGNDDTSSQGQATVVVEQQNEEDLGQQQQVNDDTSAQDIDNVNRAEVDLVEDRQE